MIKWFGIIRSKDNLRKIVGMNNKMVKQKEAWITTLAVAVTLALLFTACAPAPTGLAEKEKVVEFGIIGPFTGAGGSSMQTMVGGNQDYLRYFNESQAIPGVSVKFLWGDTTMQFSLLYSHYERFVERGLPLIEIEEATGLTGLKERFERDEVVVFSCGAGYQAVVYPEPGWRYTITPTIAEQAAVAIEYFLENWQGDRPPRLAFMVIDSPWGYEPGYATEYFQGLGFEVLPVEVVPFVTLDATSQLLRLKASGADLVYIQGLPATVGPVLRDAERLGLLGQMRFAGHSSGMGERVIEMTGVASEGYFMARTCPWFDDTEVPGIGLILDNMMKYHGEVQREGEYFTGWVGGAVMCEAIRRAIENVGYDNLDGPAVKAAFDGMKDFDVYGLASITYKPDDHRGATKMAVYEVRGGKVVRVSDWREAPMLILEE